MIALTLMWVLAQAPVAPGAEETTSKHRLSFSFAFAHWFGATFDTPIGYSTPSLTIGVRPALSFLEVRGRYSMSVDLLPLPNGRNARVGFASIEVVALREMRLGSQALVAFAGPLGIVNHAEGSAGGGFGLAIGIEYLFRTGLPNLSRLGIAVSTRQVFYQLPGEAILLTKPRQDAQVDIGVIATLF